MKVKFTANGIRVDGKHIPCHYNKGWYSVNGKGDGKEGIAIYAKSYLDRLPDIFREKVQNDTDYMTDYFDKDRVYVFPGEPLYEEVKKAYVTKRRGDLNRWIAKIEKRQEKGIYRRYDGYSLEQYRESLKHLA
jgi:hypothetical protein